MKTAAATPILTEADVIAGARARSLPPAWQMAVRDGSLRPLHWPGDLLTIARGPGRRGTIVCVVAGDRRIAWRRALDVRGGEALMRGEIAPFTDGWCGGVAGHVQARSVLEHVAERFPRGWTGAGWSAAWTIARLRSLRASAPPFRRRKDVIAFSTRPIPPPPGEPGRDLSLGLYTGDGAMAGSVQLAYRGGQSWLTKLEIRRAWRGRGGGLMLVKALLAAAAASGIRCVRSYVAARNFPSLSVHERAGFVRTGRWWRDPRDVLRASEYQLLELEAVVQPRPETESS